MWKEVKPASLKSDLAGEAGCMDRAPRWWFPGMVAEMQDLGLRNLIASRFRGELDLGIYLT